MSELKTTTMRDGHFRWQLLASVSSLALLASAANPALAADADRPTVWIELGGQLSRQDGGETPYLPHFGEEAITVGLGNPAVPQRLPRYAIGGEAEIAFLPEGTDWSFSAALRYGRANSSKHAHHAADVPKYIPTGYGGAIDQPGSRYFDTKYQHNESHAILDFKAGKDVGLGMFGEGGSSHLSLGVRFAQFSSRSKATLAGNPDFHFAEGYLPSVGMAPKYKVFHAYRGDAQSNRSFTGIGPALSWDASARIMGGREDPALNFDWGVNAAIIFGRQKTVIHQKTGEYYLKGLPFLHYQMTTYAPVSATHRRDHSVVIPNIGGFAGLSYRFPNAKLSLGYRADFFFYAMDGGQVTRSTADRNFFGPFAKISVGLGG